MARCTHCDSHVSAEFVRVFGDESGDVYACQRCAPNAGIAAVTRDRSPDP